MTGKRIDIVNCGLIVISLALAYLLPFKLFVFSYVVLGPLHYMTEIGWLDSKSFFIRRKSDVWWIVGLCTAASIATLTSFFTAGEYPSQNMLSFIHPSRIVLTTVLAAVGLVFVKSGFLRMLWVISAYALVIFMNQLPSHLMFFAMFVPTVVHVFVFTFFFMTQGAIRSKSKFGGLASIMLLGAGGMALFLSIDPFFPDEFSRIFMEQTRFDRLHPQLGAYLGIKSPHQIQVFLAFAYTYHYLNWFSKTGIIKWHKVERWKLVTAVIIWVGSVGLYFIDMHLAVMSLFFLSLLHVFLELPLNVRSVADIGEAIGRRIIHRK